VCRHRAACGGRDADACGIVPAVAVQDLRIDGLDAAVVASPDDEWWTPRHVADAARITLGGVIDLDPASCAEANLVIGAQRIYTADDDGLSRDWAGTVWCNPPFSGRQIRDWYARVRDHDSPSMILIPATRGGHCMDAVERADAIVWLYSNGGWSGPAAAGKTEPWSAPLMAVCWRCEPDPAVWAGVGVIR